MHEPHSLPSISLWVFIFMWLILHSYTSVKMGITHLWQPPPNWGTVPLTLWGFSLILLYCNCLLSSTHSPIPPKHPILTPYTKDREGGGCRCPIISFRAISHILADVWQTCLLRLLYIKTYFLNPTTTIPEISLCHWFWWLLPTILPLGLGVCYM